MADIAAVFHWSPATLEGLGLADLMGWHARAIDRLKAMNGIKD